MKKLLIYIFSSLLLSGSLLAGWTEAEKIVQGAGDGNLSFGYSMDADGDYLIVGAPDEQISHVGDGAAYIYRKNASGNFEFFFKINGYKESLGTDVAVSDGGNGKVLVAVGSPDYEFYNLKTGTTDYNDVVHIYKLNAAGTSFDALRSIYDNNGTGLGNSVDIAYIDELQMINGFPTPVTVGAVVVMGVPQSIKTYTDFYSYETGEWQDINLTAGTTLDEFGYSVAVNNQNPIYINSKARVIIGMPKANIWDQYRSVTLNQRGKAYIYELSGSFSGGFSWINEQELSQGIALYLLSGTHYNEYTKFGTSVDISGDKAIVGARKTSIGSDLSFVNPGEARIFSLSNPDDNSWITNKTLTQSYGVEVNSAGYGMAVALDSNTTAIVGAPYLKNGADIVGGIFTYVNNDAAASWDETGVMLNDTLGRFGTSVDFVDGSPIVGNPDLDTVSALRYLFDGASPSIIMYLLN